MAAAIAPSRSASPIRFNCTQSLPIEPTVSQALSFCQPPVSPNQTHTTVKIKESPHRRDGGYDCYFFRLSATGKYLIFN
jgi:hypothetical protein